MKESVKAPKITVTVVPAQANGLMVNITSWEWIDPDEHLIEGVLVMLGASMEAQVDFDKVVSMLPSQISATISGVDGAQEIALAGWTCPDFAKDESGNWPVQGEYTFTAALPEGYALSDNTKPLDLTVRLGGGNMLTAISPSYSWYTAMSNTYTISTEADLLGLSNIVNGLDSQVRDVFRGKTITLTNDIVITSENWIPIGDNSSDSLNVFSGTFDGGNHTITGVKISRDVDKQGLFGKIDGGTVKNLELADCNIGAPMYVGGIAGEITDGTISNCTVSGTIYMTGGITGGIVGDATNSPITACKNYASINGTGDNGAVGGIVGYFTGNDNGRITGCSNYGSIRNLSTIAYTGGIVGQYKGGNIDRCKNYGDINGTGGESVGGIIGTSMLKGDSKVSNCVNTGDITGNGLVGGICGDHIWFQLTIESCSNTGDITDTADGSCAGGILGVTTAGNPGPTKCIITKCWSAGTITSPNAAGGIAGVLGTPYDIVTDSVSLCNGIVSGNYSIRVAGASVDDLTMENNYAWSGMSISENTNASAEEQGIAASTSELLDDSFWSNLGIAKPDPWPGYIITQVTNKAIQGVTPPVRGASPVAAITETDEYTGTVAWNPVPSGAFAADTAYTATITLTPKTGYTLQGVSENFFTVTGATSVSNDENSGTVTAVFPPTGTTPAYVLSVIAPVFTDVHYGYEQPNAQAITITSSGNSDTTITGVALSGTDAGSFTINKTTGATIAAGGTDNTTYTIQPKGSLAVKTYTVTITVNYNGGATATANVRFTVKGAAQVAPPAPELVQKTTSSVMLKEIAPNTNGAAAQYSRDGGATWQDSREFTSLSSGTAYSFTVRYAEVGNYEASPASEPLRVTTSSSSSGGGGSSGGSSSGNNSNIAVTTPTEQPNLPVNGEIKVDGAVDKDGNATVKVSDQAITDAINATKKQAGKNGISLTVNITFKETANSLTVTIPEPVLNRLIAGNVKELKISNSLISMSFNLEALKEIQKSVIDDLIITTKKLGVKTLSSAAQAVIGSRPVFDLSMQGGGKEITSFGQGAVSVWMPYTLAANETDGNVQAVYVDDKGAVNAIISSSYDQDSKTVMFGTTHFSIFGVSYKQDAPKLNDITTHWAKNDIEFVVARGLLSGTGNNQFSPNTAMTRGMFVTALGKLAGADTNSYKTSKFTDVPETAYYAPYANWAVSVGITSGTTVTMFSPDESVTRQGMAVFMSNYAKAMGYTVPKARAAVTFADNSSIASWAADAIKQMQMAGVINGRDGNRFDPAGTATRAEACAVLHRYVELVIDPVTANGWVKNDSGHWLYYKGGKTLTGWQEIEGKWYYFNENGEM